VGAPPPSTAPGAAAVTRGGCGHLTPHLLVWAPPSSTPRAAAGIPSPPPGLQAHRASGPFRPPQRSVARPCLAACCCAQVRISSIFRLGFGDLGIFIMQSLFGPEIWATAPFLPAQICVARFSPTRAMFGMWGKKGSVFLVSENCIVFFCKCHYARI